jgi:diphthine synthase
MSRIFDEVVCCLGKIVFVGLGLNDDLGVSIHGLEEARNADTVFIELYTSVLPEFLLERLEATMGKKAQLLTRKELEDDNGKRILDAGKIGKAVFLVPGDPLIATTHVALRIEAHKRGIETQVVHGASVLSAVIGLSGLHNYKFGKSVTIPFPEETPCRTPYSVIAQNKKLGLHTLCLLDIKTEENRFLSIREGLESLLKVETEKNEGVVTADYVAVGVARAGSTSPIVRAGFINELVRFDFGGPPQSLILVGSLHFMEAEALITLASAPEHIRRFVE